METVMVTATTTAGDGSSSNTIMATTLTVIAATTMTTAAMAAAAVEATMMTVDGNDSGSGNRGGNGCNVAIASLLPPPLSPQQPYRNTHSMQIVC